MKKIALSLISFIFIFVSSCSSQPSWVLLHPTTSPPPLGQSGFAYNTNTNEGIVFGGLYRDKWSDDTWIWDGNNWSILNVTNKPPARTNLAMAYDESRDKMVIFGGSMDKTVFDDTWEWDGNDWKLINPAHTPPARCCHAMAYDSVQKKSCCMAVGMATQVSFSAIPGLGMGKIGLNFLKEMNLCLQLTH